MIWCINKTSRIRLEFRDISHVMFNLLLLLQHGFSFSWCIMFQFKSLQKWPNKIYSTQENKINEKLAKKDKDKTRHGYS